MTRILFVDDEVKVLRGMERMLMDLAGQWEMAFAQSGAEALAAMAVKPFDVLVTDVRMPEMDGRQLLSEVMRLYPDMVRVVLSGQSDQEMILAVVGTAHQCLAKPCDPEQLRRVIGRACGLRDVLADPLLRGLVSGMTTLPSLPDRYREIMDQVEATDGSIKALSEIISQDIAMTAKVLQLVNSAFCGLSRHVSDSARAVHLLGFSTVRSLVLSLHVFSELISEDAGIDFAALCDHSLATGAIARRIASAEGCDKQTADHAMTAGMLHDVGRLLLAVNKPESYQQVRSLCEGGQVSTHEAEKQIFQTSHAEVGAYLVGLWGLPEPILEAVAFHHRPLDCVEATFTPLTAVHAADALEHARRAEPGTREAGLVSAEYMARLSLTERFLVWQDQCAVEGRS